MGDVLVGRDRQVGQLRSSLAALSEGRGGLLLVAGDAGIGKTRLAEEAIRLAHAVADAPIGRRLGPNLGAKADMMRALNVG